MVAIKCSHEFYEQFAGNHINDFIKAKYTDQSGNIYFLKCIQCSGKVPGCQPYRLKSSP